MGLFLDNVALFPPTAVNASCGQSNQNKAKKELKETL